MLEFSVIIPAFNSQSSILRALQSIENQSYKDYEIIVVDDGSTDTTPIILDQLRVQLQLKIMKHPNRGVSASRNLGATEAHGKWLIFLDADDEMSKNALLDFKTSIDSHPDSLLFIAGNKRITSSENIINLPEKGKYYPFLAGAFCLSKKVFDQVGGYDTSLKFSENTELFHRLMLQNVKPYFLKDISLIYHESENGGSKNLQNMIDSLLIILDKHQSTLSSQVKYLYHQIIGVNYMRFQNFPEARKHFIKAISYKPYRVGTLARLCISLMPLLAKKLYPKEVKL